jgi:pimeloyl-ACP methyl ester carboxylesterase
MPFEERSLVCGGMRLNVAVGPCSGPPLVLLHGVTREWRDWSPVLPALAERWQVFALDHRGHGGSARAAGAYRVADFAADAAAFFHSHLDAGAVLWGHSLGAMTAAVVAARAPEKVRALVLEDPPGTLLAGGLLESRYLLQFQGVRALVGEGLGAEALAGRLARLPVQHPRDGRIVEFREIRDEAALRFGAECLVRMDPTVLDVLLAERWLEGLDWFGEMRRIACPALLLRADPEFGGMLSAEEAARIVGSVSDIRRVERPGVGHNLHAMDTEGTLLHVHDFLGSLAANPER